jgi:serine kinase of HPr protein (carbohydrate metabolism regulator)
VSVVLVTGMSGAGTSAELAELARRGHRIVDTDYGDWTEDKPTRASLGEVVDALERIAAESAPNG